MDLYEIIGVTPDATEEEIARAGREAAKKHHPDKGGDPAHFHKVSRALTVLRDPAQRAKYDKSGLDDGPINEDAQALMLLSGHLAGVLGAQIDFRYDDVVSLIRGAIENQITQLDAQIVTTDEHLRRLAEYKRRLKRRDKLPNTLRRVLEGQEREANQKRESIQSGISVHRRALELAEGYVWETDERPPVSDLSEAMRRRMSGSQSFTDSGFLDIGSFFK